MILIDVHAHLDFPDYEDKLDELIKRQIQSGVKVIIANGVTPASNRKVQILAEQYPIIQAAYGYYPVHVASDGLEAFYKELDWIQKNNPRALGEIGLDYKQGDDNPHGDTYKAVQQEAFKAFIELSNKLDIPLIVHSRKAEQDAIDMLIEHKARKVVMHCFMGKQKQVLRARDAGFSFSVPVVVTKLEQTRWLVDNVPLKQLLTETDSPYMSPTPGQANEPANVKLAIQEIAKIKGLDEKEVSNHIYYNYQQLFL